MTPFRVLCIAFATSIFAATIPTVSSSKVTAALVPQYEESRGFVQFSADAEQRLEPRWEQPMMEKIILALEDSNLVTSIIDYVLLDPELADASANGLIWALRNDMVDIPNFLTALQKSGLGLELIHIGLDDPEIAPGLLRIVKEALVQSNISIFGLIDVGKNDYGDVESAAIVPPEPPLEKREDPVLNDMLRVVKETGLAETWVVHLMTSPELAEPQATLVLKLIHFHAISAQQIIDALRETNFLHEMFRQIMQDRELLEKVGHLIAQRIMNGVLPRIMWEEC